jgi:hypothetical protein
MGDLQHRVSPGGCFVGPFSPEMPGRPGGGTWWRTFPRSILLVHNLIRSRVLLRMAGVEL